MIVTSVISTKGGVGKTTITANLGGFLADAGIRVLLIDMDRQPTLSSYYKLVSLAKYGVYELLALNEKNLDHLISLTTINNLDVIYSNDDKGQLDTLLLHAPDGRFRFKNLLPIFEPHYDLVLIDTQGTRCVTLEMAIIASDKLISPVVPELLAAREFRRGTLQLIKDLLPFKHLGINIPNIEMMMNRVPAVSNNARMIQRILYELFEEEKSICYLQTAIPAIEAYGTASIMAKPVHQVERRKPSGRQTPAAMDAMNELACEVFPQWQEQFKAVVEGKNLKGAKYVP